MGALRPLDVSLAPRTCVARSLVRARGAIRRGTSAEAAGDFEATSAMEVGISQWTNSLNFFSERGSSPKKFLASFRNQRQTASSLFAWLI